MIVRSILVESWRCFVKPTRVGPFGDGLNVVHAPNGTGKSTLFEALRRGLLDNHAVTGQEVEALRPWGRVLAPSVTVEFEHEGQSYRFAKRFLDKASSELFRHENDEWLKLDAGPKADERVRKLLTQRTPGRGLAKSEHWGLAQVLWAPQGDLSLARPSNDVVADIRNSLSAQVTGAEGSAIEQRIEALYRTYFAPVTGKLRTGRDAPAAARLFAQLDEARERLEQARTQHEAFTTAARRVDELRAARARAKELAEKSSAELSSARSAAEGYAIALRESESWTQRRALAQEKYRSARAALEHLRRARQDLAQARQESAAFESEASLREREVLVLADAARAAGQALTALEERERDVERAEKAAARAERWVALAAESAALAERAERVAAARRAWEALRTAREAITAPDARALREARKAAEEARRARERWEEALVTLELRVDASARATVLAGEGEKHRAREISPGETLRVRGLPEVEVEIAGLGRVRALGPAGASGEALAREKLRAEEKLAGMLAAFGAHDVEALEVLAERARAAEQEAATARARLEALLEGGTEDDLAVARARAQSEREALLRAEPGWAEEAPDARSLRARAESQRASLTREAAEARARASSAERSRAEAERALSVARARGEEARKRAAALSARLAEDEAGGKSDEAREAEVSDAALEFDAARGRAREAEEKLAALGPDPRGRVEQWSERLRAAEGAYQTALEQEKSEEGRLAHLSGLGTYSQLAQAEEELQRLESAARDEGLRAEAVRLLRNTLAQCRAEAVAAVATPVQEAATQTLWRIAGERLGGVQLGEGFEPAGVMPALAEGAAVQLESVSGGEREQIHLATRLALAEVLAREGRQLVVLDDVLTATDAGRLARVLRVLEEKSERLQVLLITCHPERYRGLQGARFFDLEAIAKESAG